MTPEERSLIEGLFQRLNEAAKTLPANQIDPEADRAIRAAVLAQPIAPYLLVQNALVMENAMIAAQARIAELEAEKAAAQAPPAQPRSFLSGASPWTRGSAVSAPAPQVAPPAYPQQGYPRQGYPQQGYPQQGYGQPQPAFGQAPGQPSFLRSALTTAAGVAGGALLFQGVSSLLSSHGGGTGLAGAAQAAGAAATPSVVNETISNHYGEQPAGGGAQSASYEPSPAADDRGYTPASYDAPEPDYGSDFGGEEV
jgi:hypothetical protein